MQTKPNRKKNICVTNNEREKANTKLKKRDRVRHRQPINVKIKHNNEFKQTYIYDKKRVHVNSSKTTTLINPNYDTGIQNVTENTELGEALRELNLDKVENNRMSGIDMRARLHYLEVSNILALDTLVAFKLLPQDVLSFTRQKKRLSVSLKGEGRTEIVQIVGGKQDREEKAGLSWFDKLRGKQNNVNTN